MGRQNGRYDSDFLKSGVLYCVETNAPFVGRVKKGDETSVYITEFAIIRILDVACSRLGVGNVHQLCTNRDVHKSGVVPATQGYPRLKNSDLTPRRGRCALPHCKVVGGVEAAHGGNSSPSLQYWCGAAREARTEKPRVPELNPGCNNPSLTPIQLSQTILGHKG